MSCFYHTSFRAMGCQVEAQLETEQDGAALLAALPAQFESLEAQLSRFRPESDLMRLNDCAGNWTAVSDALYDNIATAKQAANLTDGLYNPLIRSALVASGYDRSFETIDAPQAKQSGAVGNWREIQLRRSSREVLLPVGGALDLGGIAKGWTAWQVAEQLSAYGACLISVGGDIAVRGTPRGTPGWSITIPDPATGQQLCALLLSDTAVVTSGTDYRRWRTADGQLHHHIIDPRTGQSAASDVLSVSIVHPHAPTAEAYSKAVLLLGSQAGLDWLNRQWNAAGMLVCQDGTVLATSRWLTLMERALV